MAGACGTFSRTGRVTRMQRSLLLLGQSYSFTSRSRFTTAHVWAWKKCGNQTSLCKYMKGQRWRQSPETACSTLLRAAAGAWFVAALYILHSLLPDHDPNINTLEHFCRRFGFLWCLVLISFSNVTYREYKKNCWQMNTKLWVISGLFCIWLGVFYESLCFGLCFSSCNLCQNSPTSFVCYNVWLQRSVCIHLLLIDIICPWPSLVPHSPAKHHVLLSDLFFFLIHNVFSFLLQTSVCLRRRLSNSTPDKHGSLKLNPFPLISLASFVRINALFLRYSFVRILITNAIWTDPNLEEKRQRKTAIFCLFCHFSSIWALSNWYCYIINNEVSWSI